MYYSIIPIIKTIRGVSHFIYHTTTRENISPGTLVRIPWRHQKIYGINWQAVKNKPNFSIKNIINTTSIVLPKQYLDFIKWLADYYFISLSHAFKIALPAFPNKLLQNKPQLNVNKSCVLSIGAQRIKIIQQCVKICSKKAISQTFIYTTIAEVIAIIIGVLKQTNYRLVIILPEENHVNYWSTVLHNFQPITVTARTNKQNFYQAWLEMLSGGARLFIGTKRLSLFPLTNMQQVYLIDAENQAHKQWDQNPRYHVATILQRLHSTTKIATIYFNQSVTVEQYVNSYINQTLIANLTPPPFTLIDMANEYNVETKGLLSHSVISACDRAKTPLLWFNKKGDGKFLLCTSCGKLFFDLEKTYCDKCQAVSLVLRGYGTTTIVNILKKIFSHRSIIEITKDEPFLNIDYSTKPIIVCTDYIYKIVNWKYIDYSAVIAIDALLVNPYYAATERILHQLTRLRNCSQQLAIQTHSPTHSIFKALAKYFPEDWYKIETNQRKMFKLPPYATNISIKHRITKKEIKNVNIDQLRCLDANWIIDREA